MVLENFGQMNHPMKLRPVRTGPARVCTVKSGLRWHPTWSPLDRDPPMTHLLEKVVAFSEGATNHSPTIGWRLTTTASPRKPCKIFEALCVACRGIRGGLWRLVFFHHRWHPTTRNRWSGTLNEYFLRRAIGNDHKHWKISGPIIKVAISATVTNWSLKKLHR